MYSLKDILFTLREGERNDRCAKERDWIQLIHDGTIKEQISRLYPQSSTIILFFQLFF